MLTVPRLGSRLGAGDGLVESVGVGGGLVESVGVGLGKTGGRLVSVGNGTVEVGTGLVEMDGRGGSTDGDWIADGGGIAGDVDDGGGD